MSESDNNYEIISEIILAYNESTGSSIELTDYYEFIILRNFNEFEVIQSADEDELNEYSGYYHRIFKWKGKYYKFVFQYQSHFGYFFDFGYVKEVIPFQVTNIIFKEI